MLLGLPQFLQNIYTPVTFFSLKLLLFSIMKTILSFCLLFVLTFGRGSAQNLDGAWEGNLHVQGMKIRLVFHFLDTNAGYSAKMDSPDQGAFGIPVDDVNFLSPKLTLKIAAANIVYKGSTVFRSNTSGTNIIDSIVGTFKQNGMELPLTLHPMLGPPEIDAKIQDPKLPLPYATEEVSFQHDGVTLGGTLSLPNGAKSAPAVILISGSGQQNRDEEMMGHKPFLVIADYLTRNGYAVLRYDDRGIGASTGIHDTSTSADFAEDARAAFTYLKSRKDIKSVGLIGHSEGSSIAAMLAANQPDVAFVISLAGPGVKGDTLLLTQARSLYQSLDMEGDQAEQALAQNRALFGIINLNQSKAETEQLMRDYLKKVPTPMPEGPTSQEDYINNIVNLINTPWMLYFVRHNPADDFSKVHCPVLALNGDKDLQVDAKMNLYAIAMALKIAGNKDVTTKTIKGKNHLFQTCKTCTIQEYGQLKETFSEEVLKVMLEWMRKH